jgi:hypothetical protein
MTTKLIVVASWAAFLVSAALEYGFETDFPLTPVVWLAIAGGVMMATTAHAATNAQTRDSARSQTVVWCWNDAVASSDRIAAEHDRTKVSDDRDLFGGSSLLIRCRVRTARRLRSSLHGDCNGPGSDRIRLKNSDGLVATRATVQTVSLLSVGTTRGPPCFGHKSPRSFDDTLGRPALHFNVSPPSAEFHPTSTVRNQESSV